MATLPKYFNKEMEAKPLDELRDTVQQPELLRQVDYVLSNYTFYHRKFKDAGLEPGDIRSIRDLGRIPFTQKDEIGQSQEKGPPLGTHMTCSCEKVRRIYSSSGTTGRHTYIGLIHHYYDEVWMNIAPRSYYCGGFTPVDRVVLTVNIGPFIAGSELDSLERAGCTTAHVSRP